MILTFVEYVEPKKTSSGKFTPGKYKADGIEYVVPRGAQIELNKAYDCEVEKTVNGKWENYSVKNFFPVRQVEPTVVQPEKIAPTHEAITPQEKGAVTTPTAPSWEHKDRLISRQVAFKGAIEIVAAKIAAGKLGEEIDTGEVVEFFTERFFMLIIEQAEPATTNGSIRRPDAPVISPASLPSARR